MNVYILSPIFTYEGEINMKKLLSLILVLVILLTALAAAPFSAADDAVFREGDVLYLKVENPANWATEPQGIVLYVNFTDATREENGNASVVIADADKDRYDPSTGVTYLADKGLYQYTVTAENAGRTVMRFWRGNAQKLWNESVAITAKDLAAGRDIAVVTDWSNTGRLDSTGSIVPEPTEPVVEPTKPAVEPTEPIVTDSPVTAFQRNCVYAHAANGADDKEAWVKWVQIGEIHYFFMPSSAKAYDTVELYNTYSDRVIVGGTSIPSMGTAVFRAEANRNYNTSIEPLDLAVKVQFMFSSAEAALWVNNTERFEGYSDFFDYLKDDKGNSVAASGAISNPDGTIEETPVKKMKGRGNTSWNADKKGFNVTFESALQLAGMEKCKKFSLVSNFQDAAMARNRILFDLADEVGVPYSSDSRFIDLYTNGVYQGTYQICQKIDVGKNTLISDFSEDDYLETATGGVKDDFCFVAEIDSSPADDDFHFNAKNGNNLTMKAPELSIDSYYYYAVSTYISEKYNAMYNSLQRGNVGDYLDITSMAKVYIINELGKNWDSGASSFYFTYKPDANGNYKFFASPVWDYDNSLGNANGVARDLRNMGISDYTLPSGWFASKKNGYNGPNVLAESVRNPLIMAEVRRVWFEDFLPAFEKLNSSGSKTGEIYSSDVYANILRDSAAMNYKIWELVTNSSWIADHSSVKQYRAAYTKNQYGQVTGVNLTQDNSNTNYQQYTFDGQFDYMMDWTNSRAAWLSAQWINDYVPSEPDIQPTEPPTEAPTAAPTIPPEDVIIVDLTNAVAAWCFDATDKVEGNKLKEYGNADDGYDAVRGHGKMTLSVSGDKNRALEWSAPEYGHSGAIMSPIMAAGSKNQWSSPYINLHVPTAGYDQLKITAYFAGSSKAPASWKLQYSTDGTHFTDIDGKTFTISADSRKVITAYFDKSELPDFAYSLGEESIDLRLVPVSMTTVDGGSALDTPTSGELALNYIVIDGRELTYDDVLMGDVDGDGDVTVIDATVAQRYLATITPLTSKQILAADVTRDGSPDIVDVTFIQRALAGIGNPYLDLS